MDQLKKLEKESLISEDELKRRSDELQKVTDKYIETIDKTASEKEKEILVAVHLTNIEDQQKIVKIANSFASANLDYDVFGVSYYPYWHGTMENLTDTLTLIGNTYGKKTAVLETAYAYTLEDGDGCGNSVDSVDIDENYAATVQSQATCIRDIMAATVAAGKNALGVFYWEPAWTPVGPVEEYDNNFAIWEEKGSGWASSYAAGYDPNDAGKYYGGCAWDNQAMFDHEGHPLASLNVFKYASLNRIHEFTLFDGFKTNYINIILIYIFFNSIQNNKKNLGTLFL